ncbi:MAG: 7-carboxy-7-deazaguanine synthase QueE [Akkermansiaceae bacterium]|nr:7-carboxy-7-deazaguanine synthase QueE [Akkermansiaceae bacterium]
MRVAVLHGEPEIFHSLQGEGPSQGEPAAFLRLAGCNLACRWCDTAYARGAARALELSPRGVAEIVAGFSPRPRLLVVTGGEPLLQQASLERLLPLLPGMRAEVETNGTLFPSERLLGCVAQWNVSPKLAHARAGAGADPGVLRRFARTGRAWFKFVVRDEEDWREAAGLAERAGIPRGRMLLMPLASRRAELDAALPLVAALCLKHGVRLADRLHIRLWDGRPGL